MPMRRVAWFSEPEEHCLSVDHRPILLQRHHLTLSLLRGPMHDHHRARAVPAKFLNPPIIEAVLTSDRAVVAPLLAQVPPQCVPEPTACWVCTAKLGASRSCEYTEACTRVSKVPAIAGCCPESHSPVHEHLLLCASH